MTSQDQAIAMADALTLLLHNQHGIAAAIEELSSWATRQGGAHATDNVLSALQVLDTNAKALTSAINRIRQA